MVLQNVQGIKGRLKFGLFKKSSEISQKLLRWPTRAGCVQEWSGHLTRRVYGITVFSLLFALPAMFVVSSFVVIVRELWLHAGPRSVSGVVRSRRAANVLVGRRRIVRLLGAIAIAFAVCWMPYHLLRCRFC